MAESSRLGFSIVRQGYDLDEVDNFLITQAEAWKEALAKVEQRAESLEGEMDAVRRREVALLEGLQTAAQARDHVLAQAEQELTKQRNEHDMELAGLRSQAKAAISEQLAEAEERSASILAEAEERSTSMVAEAEGNAASIKAETEADLVASMESLEEGHRATKALYEKTEADLLAKIRGLNSMRVSLVSGLEAIANGGLAKTQTCDEILDEAGLELDHPLAELLQTVAEVEAADD